MELALLNRADPASVPNLTRLWNAACGLRLSISERLVRFNLAPAGGAENAGCVAKQEGQAVGFVLTSAATGPTDEGAHLSGWIDALAVTPEAQGQGYGSQLLSWAERWLRGHGCAAARLGGGLRPFTPGLPVSLDNLAFFLNRGYAPRQEFSHVFDMARRLQSYRTPAFVKRTPVDIRHLQIQKAAELDTFLLREFPGRWHYEFQEHLRQGGRLSDYLGLWSQEEVHGFCQVTLEDSVRPIERFYLHGLPRPWGQLGPIGVSAAQRGRGLGLVLLDAGLRYLRDRGVDGCVIDWVSLPAFYEKFGFQRHTGYRILTKELVQR